MNKVLVIAIITVSLVIKTSTSRPYQKAKRVADVLVEYTTEKPRTKAK